jgi:hypothetical protein
MTFSRSARNGTCKDVHQRCPPRGMWCGLFGSSAAAAPQERSLAQTTGALRSFQGRSFRCQEDGKGGDSTIIIIH